MRIWSLHPQYLDPKGLVALWRESLLAQAVLRRLAVGAKPGGYSNHPQLNRFLAQASAIACIAEYLRGIHVEATRRGYRFDASKILREHPSTTIDVPAGQLEFERRHLLEKLRRRAPEWWQPLAIADPLVTHPLFKVVPGGIADWERP